MPHLVAHHVQSLTRSFVRRLRSFERATPVALKLAVPLVAVLVMFAIARTWLIVIPSLEAATLRVEGQRALDIAESVAEHYEDHDHIPERMSARLTRLVRHDPSLLLIRVYRLVDGAPVVWASSRPEDPAIHPPEAHDLAPLSTGVPWQAVESRGGGEMLETVHPLRTAGVPDATVGVYSSLDAARMAIGEMRRDLFTATAVGTAALAAALMVVVEVVVLRRVRRMRGTAARVAAGASSVRLDGTGRPPARDEIAHVADELEAMAAVVAGREAELRLLHQRAADEAATMTRRALHDPLTDLPNRPLLQDRLEQAITLGRRADAPVTVLMIDLDGFKAVNDRHGHQAGDELLRAVAGALVSAVRESDTVARVGGDEFAIVLPGADAAAATTVAIKVQQHIAALARTDRRFAVGASVGSAAFPADGTEPAGLLATADGRMYAVKVRRKGRRPVRSVAVAL